MTGPSPMRLMRHVGFVVVALATWRVGSAAASDGDGATPRNPASEPASLASFSDLQESLAGLNWDEEAQRLRRAVEIVWERNGWTNESDRFARDVACEVTAIPPWDVAARLNLLTTRIAERYGLNDESATRLKGSVMREAGGFLMRNGGAIIENGREALLARARGEPYTAEQVAKWAKVLEPLLTDMRASVDRLAKEVEPSLDADHKRRLDQDLQSVEKRTRYVDAMRTRWAEGKWQPTDWGLETDPIQNRAVPPRALDPSAAIPIPVAPAAQPSPNVSLPACVSYDPATWFACVLEFEKRFQLDAGQKSTAQSIHAELVERAGDYAKTHREEFRAVPMQERMTHAAYEPIRALFAELQARLDALPTTAQQETYKP
ncbi:MAG: hypothetical protein V1790_05880 [Planctomycetota bacterium]